MQEEIENNREWKTEKMQMNKIGIGAKVLQFRCNHLKMDRRPFFIK